MKGKTELLTNFKKKLIPMVEMLQKEIHKSMQFFFLENC
jgi:hypothetical protein